jgi:hypothetical protein
MLDRSAYVTNRSYLDPVSTTFIHSGDGALAHPTMAMRRHIPTLALLLMYDSICPYERKNWGE